jgi:hypothetical protein
LGTSGNNDEAVAFQAIQDRLGPMYRDIFFNDNAPRTVVVVPSLSLDQEVLGKISGVHHYEERMLCLLLLLRLPRTELVFVTSKPVPETIIDYYLHMLPGIPAQHARRRLKLFSCHDGSPIPLTEKLLARPRLLERVRQAIADPRRTHMTCFNVTALERRLALAFDIPLYGCDPDLIELGSKSGSRKIFRESGIELPDGSEDLRDAQDVADALAELKGRLPGLDRAVVKLNEGFSGEGNAVFDLRGAPESSNVAKWVSEHLPSLHFESPEMTWELYQEKLNSMEGIVEAFVEGQEKRSPSAQVRIDPLGAVHPISTHDQVLGGPNAQIFLGSRFPADDAYRLEIQEQGLRVGETLAARGVRGRFGVDFISVRQATGWRHVAIEVNLRKGGTTHTFDMLHFLTDGRYDREQGHFLTQQDQARYYYASDNLEAEAYRGLTPSDLIDIAALNQLHFHQATQEGVAFHLVGALSEFGKLGILCIGKTPERAEELRRRTVDVLDQETGNSD